MDLVHIVRVGLQIIGFSEKAEVQAQSVVSGIRWLYAVSPAIILAIGLIFALTYPLTRKRYEELSAAVSNGTADEAMLKGL